MKKILSLIISLSLLSACSLFQKNEPAEDDVAPVPVTAQDFETVMDQMHAAYVDYIMQHFPENTIGAIAEQMFSFEGMITPPDENVEEITFSITSEGGSDVTDAENPMSEGLLTIDGSMTGVQTGSAHIELALKVINQAFFFSLQQAQVTMDEQPFPLLFMIEPYTNKWYTATFEEINQFIQQSAQEELPDFRIQDSFMSPNEMLESMRTRLLATLDEVHLWNEVETLGAEDGWLMYSVELDKEKLKTSVLALTRFALTTPNGILQEEAYAQAAADIEAEFAEANFTLTGTLSVSEANVRHFMFEGMAEAEGEAPADVMMSWTADGMTFGVTQEENEMLFIKEGENYSLTIDGTTMLEGTHTDEQTTGMIYDEDGSQQATFELNKTGDKQYNGWMDIPLEEVKIMIDELAYSDTSFHMTISAEYQESEVFSGQMNYEMNEVDSVEVTAPESSESIQMLLGQLMGGMMGGMGMEGDAMMMDDPVAVPGMPPEAMMELEMMPTE